MRKFYSIVLLLLFTAVFQIHLSAQRLTVSGQKIINSSNSQEVVLNAVNFGNWMIMEGYMMNSANQATSQHLWKQKLNTLIGTANTNAFYTKWINNHVTRADINQIKAWGFNSVRVPLHYEYFVNLGTPDVWNTQGFTVLDSIFSWCKSAGIYAVVDLHAAPGGQNDGDISDYDNTKPSLWTSEANKSKTVRLWRKISERYKNEDCIAGYDLINEPAWTLPNPNDLRNLYGRLTDTIRANGDSHILFIEGNWYANDFTNLTPAWDANMVYTFHKYWSNTTNQEIQWMLDIRTAQNRPIWCGEHGENSNTHYTKTAELFKANNIGMSWWPMKKFESINDFADAKWPAGYQDLLNYFGGTNPSLSPSTAINTLNQLAENVKLANCKINDEVLRAIFTQVGNRNTEAFANNSIPGRIYAPNYDKGMNGYAYSDQAWEDMRISTGTYTSWNNGWTYRNNGVDVEPCTDALSNGYDVGWFNAGEWMKYTCNVASAGTYTLELRVVNGTTSAGEIQIQNADGTQILASASVPPTGSWTNWTTITCSCNFSSAGTQTIRIANTFGSFNVASANFIYQNSSVLSPVATDPVVNVIDLKGVNGSYVTYSGSSNLLSSTSATVGTNEKFTLVDAGNGLQALKGGNGMYVSLNAADNKLYCNSATIGDYQKFTLNNLCGVYTIKGFNNNYVSSENGATTGLTCTRTQPSGWEYFNWDQVAIPVTDVAISPASTTLLIGASLQLSANIAPANATTKYVRYTSSNPAVASVSLTGLVTGKAAGTATITGTTTDGGKTAICSVTVSSTWTAFIEAENYSSKSTAPTAESCSDTGAGLDMGYIGNGDYMVYNVNVPTAGIYTLSYRVASTSANGQLIFGLNGTDLTPALGVPNTNGWQNWTTITIPVNLAAGSQYFTVYAKTGGFNLNWLSLTSTTNVAVTGVSLSAGTLALTTGASSQLTATITPSNASNKNVNWSSSNTAVATVSTTGLVTAVSAGTANITVTTVDGGKTAVCAVTVNSLWSQKIEAEAYSSKSSAPTSETCTDAGGGSDMGYIGNGDYMVYAVTVPSAGTYTLSYRVASTNATGQVILGLNGTDLTPALSVPNTNGWQTWTTITNTTPVTLSAGTQYLTVYAKTGGFNINWWSLTATKGETISKLEPSLSCKMILYPNPTKGESVNLGLTGFSEGTAQLQILNAAGILVKSQEIIISSQASTESINISELANGLYMVVLKNGEEIKLNKLMINK